MPGAACHKRGPDGPRTRAQWNSALKTVARSQYWHLVYCEVFHSEIGFARQSRRFLIVPEQDEVRRSGANLEVVQKLPFIHAGMREEHALSIQ